MSDLPGPYGPSPTPPFGQPTAPIPPVPQPPQPPTAPYPVMPPTTPTPTVPAWAPPPPPSPRKRRGPLYAGLAVAAAAVVAIVAVVATRDSSSTATVSDTTTVTLVPETSSAEATTETTETTEATTTAAPTTAAPTTTTSTTSTTTTTTTTTVFVIPVAPSTQAQCIQDPCETPTTTAPDPLTAASPNFYAVTFPGRYKTSTISSGGQTVREDVFKQGTTVFAVSSSLTDTGLEGSDLDVVAEATASNANGKVLNAATINIGAFEGRSFTISIGKTSRVIFGQVFAVDGKIVEFLVGGTKGASLQAKAATFFASIVLGS